MQNNQSIFRNEALQRYISSREESVLPRFVRPKIFLFLWILTGLLIVACGVAWYAQLPVYVTGQGIVIQGRGNHLQMLVLVSAENAAPTKQSRIWLIAPDGKRHEQMIKRIEKTVQSPQSIYQNYSEYATSLTEITKYPSWLAVSSFELTDETLSQDSYLGSQYKVDVEIGSQRLITLFPFVGRFLRG